MNTASNTSNMKQQGLTIGQLRTAISNDWKLSEDVKQFMASYFLRKWHTRNLLALIKDGQINYEGKKYQVVWLRGKVAATANEMCFLSFRRCYSSNVQPVVLVKDAPAITSNNCFDTHLTRERN